MFAPSGLPAVSQSSPFSPFVSALEAVRRRPCVSVSEQVHCLRSGFFLFFLDICMYHLTRPLNSSYRLSHEKHETNQYSVIGEEGPSLMGLEDMAMFRTLPTATIFYPSDGVSTEKAVELAATTKVSQCDCRCDHSADAFYFVTSLPSFKLGCLLHPNQPPRQLHHLQQQ